jgi:hypothetical protein
MLADHLLVGVQGLVLQAHVLLQQPADEFEGYAPAHNKGV